LGTIAKFEAIEATLHPYAHERLAPAVVAVEQCAVRIVRPTEIADPVKANVFRGAVATWVTTRSEEALLHRNG
jgi:hypothetical protein